MRERHCLGEAEALKDRLSGERALVLRCGQSKRHKCSLTSERR